MEQILLGFGKERGRGGAATGVDAGKRKNIVLSLIDHVLNLPTGSSFLSARIFRLMFHPSCRPEPS